MKVWSLDDVAGGTDASRDVVEIGPDLYWVGHFLEGDPFQCHVYLLDQGDESVVFDPGSALTFRHVLPKIEHIVPVSKVRYWVAHHQDPDITGAFPLIDQLISRDDAVIVTHWRAEKLLRHLGLRNLPFWLVDEHDWRLRAGDRELRFVFTPYAHFPGAFCTYEERTGTLLSSDLFGGFTDGFSLLAEDRSYLESMRPFHEHYIPSREVMRHALEQIRPLAPTTIAPQHGSLLRGPLIEQAFTMLDELECGLYLLGTDRELARLMRLGRVLREVTHTLLFDRDFRAVALALLEAAQDVLPVASLEFWVRVGDSRWLCLDPETRYRGRIERPPSRVLGCVEAGGWDLVDGTPSLAPLDSSPSEARGPALVMSLDVSGGTADAAAVFRLNEPAEVDPATQSMLERLGSVMAVAVEREALTRSIDLERQQIYERSIRDPLTGVYTRRYMTEAFERLASAHDRDPAQVVSMALLDIDFFKSVNDTYGHPAGDQVLAAVARTLVGALRRHDVVVRLGGEEFAVLVVAESPEATASLAERMRSVVETLRFDGPMAERRITVSVGVAARSVGEPLDDLLARADMALYLAKTGGRNRVETADLAEETRARASARTSTLPPTVR